ncbi:hypothetical protein [Clostridium butyricum]|uniref:hypothetical protein n=1 Tax=Clostridium butyricum TaxID=1492 RepID=UPI00016B9A6F|nr:hypothetical protein [Clostridium butyricum]EDT73657.1 hypothetical protein CBY_2306 [Clostridium butyricum 5521]NFL31131.1 hypothetical protein [Clostridium butyricum]
MKKKIISLVSALILFNSVPAFAGTTDTTTNELLSTNLPKFTLHKIVVDYVFDDRSNKYKTIITIDETSPVFLNELSKFLKVPPDIVDKINKERSIK